MRLLTGLRFNVDKSGESNKANLFPGKNRDLFIVDVDQCENPSIFRRFCASLVWLFDLVIFVQALRLPANQRDHDNSIERTSARYQLAEQI